MKKCLFLLTAALVALSMFAAPVDQATAMKVAKTYLTAEINAGRIMGSAAVNPVLIKTEYSEGKVVKPVYYIFNTSTTYLVVAGDDRAEEILMVGDMPLKDINNLPPGMLDMLSIYKEEIQYLHENPHVTVKKISEQKSPSLRAVTYGPLLTALWDQGAPYWNQCVFTYNGRSYQCYTGCPATSAAMVLYYWKYPASVAAIPSYTEVLELSNTQQVDNYTYPALPATTFNWSSMRNSYSWNSTGTSATAVATLMRYVGQAEGMMYGTESAGGSGIWSNENYRIANMFRLFGYKSTARNVYKSSYSENSWANLLQGELAAGRPMVYCAIASPGGGHAFNVDGWRDSDNKYHVNFGWSGVGNNWLAMNAFKDDDGYTFNNNQQAIVGIEPPSGSIEPTPVLTVDPTTLTFTDCQVGQTYTKTFTVSGTDLEDGVTISGAGSSSITVSPTTLTKAQATAGATVTVTYSPTAAGTHTKTITVSSSGATNKTIAVQGVATGSGSTTGPKLTANPTSIGLNTAVGTPVTDTFILSGTNLTDNVYLSVSGDGFSINKEVVTKTAVMNGVEVTVTYDPTSGGTHEGAVTITSNGADPITVDLYGVAAAIPVINVDPASLSFSTTVGQAVTKTFAVVGVDLSSNVTLSVEGDGFSIDKSSISKRVATNGTNVTVTYNPTSSGNHTGTVTLNSAGAEPVTVSLTGTATASASLSANPTSLSFNTVAGTPVSETFTVNGSNLTGNVTVVCNGNGFTADKTSITKDAANAGATVTVTYSPTSAGNHTGTITLICSGVPSVTVALTGTATEPVRTITVTPTALDFTALVGQISTQTFNVSGENLVGNLTVALSGANGVYSVTPTTITAAQAMAGNVPVTVTYAPMAFGIQNATVTISGGGAPAATVTLNGNAYLTGDVNLDGSVNISDVTTLINALLSNTVPNEICADVNGDGSINISDVTILINSLLAGNH